MKPRLYLLKPDFSDRGEGPWFCPESALVEGMLAFYPALRDMLDVRYIDFPKPRTELIRELGEAHQACPMLVVDGDGASAAGVSLARANDRSFVHKDVEICRYLAAAYAVGRPHP